MLDFKDEKLSENTNLSLERILVNPRDTLISGENLKKGK